MRNETQQDIIVLNRALDSANASERPQVERAVVRAKVALMEPLWAEDWGELKAPKRIVSDCGSMTPFVTNQLTACNGVLGVAAKG